MKLVLQIIKAGVVEREYQYWTYHERARAIETPVWHFKNHDSIKIWATTDGNIC